MKEVPELPAIYTNHGNWLHIEVPSGTSLGKELKSFFKPPVLHKASSTRAEDWESFVISDAACFTTALELARWHFPAIVENVPEAAQSGPSTEAVAAREEAARVESTRAWYVQTGIPLPDENEPGF